MTTIAVSGPLKISRMLITIGTVIYGIIPPFVDLTETHVFHPDWTEHARFHMVWLLGTNTGLAFFAFYLLWKKGENLLLRIRAAGVLGLFILGGFFLSVLTRPIYGGALVDEQGGVPSIPIFGGLDANVTVFTPALALVILGLWLSARGTTE